MAMKHRYTEADDNVVRQLLPTHTHAEIAERLGSWATEFSVRKRCARLGLVRVHTVVWTPERDAELIRLRHDGNAFSVISKAMDITRNAAIGRAARLGIKGRSRATVDFRAKRGRALNATQKVNRARSQARSGQPKFKAEPIPDLPITAYFRGVSLLDLEPNTCRYPQGDAPEILFCGQPVVEDTSWCKHCSKIVYQTVVKRNISPEERERRVKQGRKNWMAQKARAA